MALDYAERASQDPVDLNTALLYESQDTIRCNSRFKAVVAKLHVVDVRAPALCEGKS